LGSLRAVIMADRRKSAATGSSFFVHAVRAASNCAVNKAFVSGMSLPCRVAFVTCIGCCDDIVRTIE
jgi:hypothetical protein